MSRIPAQILDLPGDERIELAQQIWESVVEHPETVSLTSAQRDELERRWQAFELNPVSSLEARRDKTRALKQGMMQELLTGRTRLVASNEAEMQA